MQPLSPREGLDAQTMYGCCTIPHDRNLFRGVQPADKISNTGIGRKGDVAKRKLAEQWISVATTLRRVEQQRSGVRPCICEEDKNEYGEEFWSCGSC